MVESGQSSSHINDVSHTETAKQPVSTESALTANTAYEKAACMDSLPNSEAPESTADTSDEELYLRRASVLYHELWTSEWVEHQAVDIKPSNDGDGQSEIGAGCSQLFDGNSNTDPTENVLELEPLGTTKPATASAKITTETTQHTMSDTMTHGNNEHADTGNADCSSRHFPELQKSWGSLLDAYVEPSSTTCDRIAPVPKFSASDLADALVGTIRRLEDDHTLRLHKRWSVVKELAITEAHYLRDLLVLRAVFYEPLTDPVGGSQLRADDIQIIFGNLDQVIDCARSLVEYLTVAVVYEANRCCILNTSEECTSDNKYLQDTPTILQHVKCCDEAPARRQCGNRPASQPDAANFAKSGDSALRNSAWADISIAQAFLLTSQRMERVYAQYCQKFEAASRRIIELKHLAATATCSGPACATAPTTPLAPAPAAAAAAAASGSPFADHLRGWRQFPTGNGSPAHSSIASYGSIFIGPEDGSTEDNVAYASSVQRLISEQTQLLAGKTTSWDLPSLLIKPVQRILKYPLLIRSLLGLTPTHTLDRNRLEKAAQSVERIAETINAVNSTNGLRISAVSTPSTLSTQGYDSQGRITRELRRVLRRKPGNASHMRTKSHTESFVKDKLRMSIKSKPPISNERLWPTSAATSSSPVSGAEALIEQHESRLSGLIQTLRQWESCLRILLRQQTALVAWWHELYVDIDENAERATKAYTPSLLSSMHRNSSVFVSEENGCRSPMGINQSFQQQWHLVPELLLPIHSQKYNNSAYDQTSHGDPSNSEAMSWVLHKRERTARYYAALEAISDIFAETVCEPLKFKVYPVLATLMQTYSDGPRYILSEILRLSSSSSSTVGGSNTVGSSDPESDSSRISQLQRALADDLPRLFEYERTVVRLILEQIATIQHDFYSRIVHHLSESIEDVQFNVLGQINSSSSEPDHVNSKGLPANSCDIDWPKPSCTPGTNQTVHQNTDEQAGSMPPSASECTSQIKSGLWLLAQEAQRHSPAQSVVKSRHRHYTIDPTDSSDTISDNSISFDEYASVSVFDLSATTANEVSRSAWSIPAQRRLDKSLIYGESSERRLGVDVPAKSPASLSSRHMRKKSSGFIERITNFKPGKIMRSHPESAPSSSVRITDNSSMDSAKPRPQKGIFTGSSGGSPPPPIPPIVRLPSRSTLRTKSDADLRSTATRWTEKAMFEPLPTVDPIRFSKGFIDATFQMLDSQTQPATKKPAQDTADSQEYGK
ncbi:hypothetical protein IWW36_004220 [Coemansia brasiliensis]|uniref:DH domain-containing protein n=1 Tax=Coemansia brasiliensis TaxID=2650707 RepID=A0A9W8LZ93_9FUNG|nr:hypothetical protein IWW36_004220 [Coemansia brasiliensis]